MRIAMAALCLGLLCPGLMAGSAHAEERWPEAACKGIGDLEAFYSKTVSDPTDRAWAVRPLLVLLRDHCGAEVKMKLEESDSVIKLRLWPAHVCAALASSKPIRSVLAKPLDKHCSQNSMTKDKAAAK
ncbi:MAG: hypothetical protein GY844_29665 [Bradyrhizobium sp.]|nr:hypothetical protein [Bradyrhizobium sp.]